MTASVSRDDERLSQLYQHITEQQAGRFSAEYDLPAQYYRTLVRLAAFPGGRSGGR